MREGIYKGSGAKGRGVKRVMLFAEVFFLTLVIAALGFVFLHKSGNLFSFFFPASESGSVHAAAPETGFKDVPADSVDARAVVVLTEDGIISGFGDGTFRPDDKIKREEFAKLVVTALKVEPHMLSNSNCFSDVGSEWFAPFVCYAKKKQYIGGYEDGSFGTGKNITVSEGVSLLNKVFRAGLTAGDAQAGQDITRGQAATLLATGMGLIK